MNITSLPPCPLSKELFEALTNRLWVEFRAKGLSGVFAAVELNNYDTQERIWWKSLRGQVLQIDSCGHAGKNLLGTALFRLASAVAVVRHSSLPAARELLEDGVCMADGNTFAYAIATDSGPDVDRELAGLVAGYHHMVSQDQAVRAMLRNGR